MSGNVIFSQNLSTIKENKEDSLTLTTISSQRITKLAFIAINGFVLPESEITSIIASSNDSLIIGSTVQSQLQENELPLFKITLKNSTDSTEITNTYQGSTVLYTGLAEGTYRMIIQGFVPSQWQSEPVIVQFTIDNKRAKEYKGSKPTPIDTLSDTSKLAIDKYEKAKEESTKVLIYLIIGSVILTSLAVLFFFYFHTFRHKNSTKSSKTKFSLRSVFSWLSIFSFSKKQKVTKAVATPVIKQITAQNNRSNELAKILQAKVTMLENEISLLSKKTNELSKRNNDMHMTLDKFEDNDRMLVELQSQKESLTSLYHGDEIWIPSDEEVSFMMDVLEGYDLNAMTQKSIASEIKDVANSISAISKDITKVLMLESDEINLEPSQNDIQKIIQKVHKKYHKDCKEKEIALTFSALTNIPKFAFDPIRITEAYDSLLENAISYTYPKTAVSVSAFIENKNVIVEIQDQGPGITKEDLYAAFTKGAEKLNSSSQQKEVKGFSLWIVKKMIDAHKGKIWVKSRIGKGATFSFSLPLE
ncbi:MAG: hypothetical protein JNL36_03840 [Candidatus Kapabacteria bacterium]|nr:hypothetical protein [Candidatus Kapabacteria bacterium]